MANQKDNQTRRLPLGTPVLQRLVFIVPIAVLLAVAFQQSGGTDASSPPSEGDVNAAAFDAAPAGAPGDPISGDADCDGDIAVPDAIAVLEEVIGVSSASCLGNADVNCDGEADGLDGVLIVRYVAGLEVAPPAACAAIGDPPLDLPNSIELIDAALERADIDEETAHMYRVFASFADERLPAEYQGRDDLPGEPMETLELAALAYDSFSPATQAAIAPYFTRPAEPGSWVSLQAGASAQPAGADNITWQTFDAAGGKVKVWAQERYEGDVAKAQGIASAVTAKIWPKLLEVMGREPVSDLLLDNNGGSGALDIYLVHAPRDEDNDLEWLGVAEPAFPDGTCFAARYLNVDSTAPLGSETTKGLLQTVTHEVFHAFQFAFPLATGCWTPEYAWFVEASATWSEEYVYPNAQSEHEYNGEFFNPIYRSLDSREGRREYGAYLFPWHMARIGGVSYIRDAWTNFATQHVLEGLNSTMATTGGFDEQLPKYALYNWNRAPVDDYKTSDKVTKGAFPFNGLQPLAVQTIEMNLQLAYLASKYYHFKITDQPTFVEFKNTVAEEAVPHSAVWGIVKINGQWQEPEDWTDLSRKDWCREDPDENVQELVIVFTNSDWADKNSLQPSGPPTLKGSQQPCLGWRGTVSRTQTTNYSGGGVETKTVSGTILWKLHDYAEPDGKAVGCEANADPCLVYYPTGEVSWVFDRCCFPQIGGGGVPDCRDTGTLEIGVGSIIPSDQQLILQPNGLGYTYSGHGVRPTGDVYSTACGSRFVGEYFYAPESENYAVSDDLQTIQGEYRITGQGIYDEIVYTWHFTFSEE